MLLMLSKRSQALLFLPVQNQAKVISATGSQDLQGGDQAGAQEGPGALVILFLIRALVPSHVYFMKIHGAPYSTSERFSVYVLTMRSLLK